MGLSGTEVVYSRRSQRNASIVIKIYTSIREGQTAVRAAGKDSIKVCVVFDDGRKSFGVGKFPSVMRVASVESVLKRLGDTLDRAIDRATEWIDLDAWKPSAQLPIKQSPAPIAPMASPSHVAVPSAASAAVDDREEGNAFGAPQKTKKASQPSLEEMASKLVVPF